MREEKSCGAVILRKNGGKLQVLLVRHQNGGHWSFPKGHVENGETEEETALREIFEETGLHVRLIPAFRREEQYAPKPDTVKTVVYFLAVPTGGKPVRQEEEIRELGWFDCPDALARITYENSRSICLDALSYAAKHDLFE